MHFQTHTPSLRRGQSKRRQPPHTPLFSKIACLGSFDIQALKSSQASAESIGSSGWQNAARHPYINRPASEHIGICCGSLETVECCSAGKFRRTQPQVMLVDLLLLQVTRSGARTSCQRPIATWAVACQGFARNGSRQTPSKLCAEPAMYDEQGKQIPFNF